MNYALFKKLATALLVPLLVVSPVLQAQEIAFDFVPPEISHEDPVESVYGIQPRIISATVVDAAGVRQVVLRYRTKGERHYMQRDMLPGSSPSIYMATIPERDAIDPGVEYFIEATDVSGNTSSRGFSVAPIFLSIKPLSPGPEAQIQQTSNSSGSSKKWLWIGLGALVVGGVALSAGGGSDSGGESSDTVPLTVVVTPP